MDEGTQPTAAPARGAPGPRRADVLRGRARGAVALARARLRAAPLGRAGRVFGAFVGIGFAAAAIYLRASDGPDASLAGLVVGAARWMGWVAGAPLACAAAQDRRAIDRRDGIDALAASRGLSAAGRESARAVAAMLEVAIAIGAPLVLLALLTASLAGSGHVALHRAGLAIGAAVFAVIAGVTLGGIGAACGRLGRARGRWLLLAVIVGPWLFADLAGRPSWSIPGALGAVIASSLRVGGAGA